MTFSTWTIPESVILETQTAFRRGAHEVFAIWTCLLANKTQECTVSRCIVPQQTPGVSPGGGVFVHIAGAELSRIQVENFKAGERSVIQLHTHPSADVRMSRLDREWEVVKHKGALSIIVPNYCRAPLEGFLGVNVYERQGLDWRLWTVDETKSRLRIV